MCTFSTDFFKNPHTDQCYHRIRAAEQTASAVVCRIAPLCLFVDLYGRDYTGCFGKYRRQGFASGIYVCKKHSAVSPDDDCERNAEKANEDIEGYFREREVEEAGRQALLFVQAYMGRKSRLFSSA